MKPRAMDPMDFAKMRAPPRVANSEELSGINAQISQAFQALDFNKMKDDAPEIEEPIGICAAKLAMQFGKKMILYWAPSSFRDDDQPGQ